jgi:hypothetical protein
LENGHCRLSNWVHGKAFCETHAGLIAGTRFVSVKARPAGPRGSSRNGSRSPMV